MIKLTRDAQAKAKAFMDTYARPLERSAFAYYFEDGTIQDVFTELAKFQNPDGGFGHALEPDLRLADSSVIATTRGLQVLREFQAPATHPLVQGAMRYLLDMYDAERHVWPIIPPNVDDAPHAPWWGYSDDLAESWGGFLVNPRAEIVGYLHDYAELVPEALRNQLTREVVVYLHTHGDEIGMFDVLCYVRFAATSSLPGATRVQVIEALKPIVDRLVVKDPAKWEAYVLTPLEVVTSPASPFAGMLAKEVALNLDFEIEHQQPNGAWSPKWTWGDLYPDAWPQAKRDWSGILTLRTLKALRDFERLERA